MEPLALHQIEGIKVMQARVLWIAARWQELEAKRASLPSKQYAEKQLALFSQTGQLLAWDMGAGKTRAGLYIMAAWQSLAGMIENAQLRAAMSRPMLVLGEAAGIHVWKNQLQHWFPAAPPGFLAPVETGMQVKEAVAAAAAGEITALSVSYSMLARHTETFAQAAYALCICDEVQALTNADTQRAQALYRLSSVRADGLPGLLFKMGLSGTPFTNRVASLWPVLSFLQGIPKARRVRGKPFYFMVSTQWGSRSQFLSEYTVDGGETVAGKNILHDPRYYVACNYHQEADCDKLHPRMKRMVMHRVTAAEAWPNLPPADLEWLDVDLPTDQANLYNSLIEDLIVPAISKESGLENGREIDRLALMTYAFECLASGRQLQFSLRHNPDLVLPFGSGESGILDEIKRICAEIPDSESIVIFTGYAQFAHQIAEALHWMNPILLAGNTGNSAQAEADFADPRKRHRAFVATTRGIKALTLTKAKYCIIAGFLSYSPWDILQAIYRIRRPGQKADRLMIYALSIRGTLLAWLKTRLAQKLQYGLQVLDGSNAGAEVLNVQDLTTKQFRDAFKGR